jgi:uncharacterized membrane protein YecN with MAPEG domain
VRRLIDSGAYIPVAVISILPMQEMQAATSIFIDICGNVPNVFLSDDNFESRIE